MEIYDTDKGKDDIPPPFDAGLRERIVYAAENSGEISTNDKLFIFFIFLLFYA